MFHFFRRSKIVLDCFTDNEYIALTAPIQKASAFLPQWWKDLPKSVELFQPDASFPIGAPTLKTCYGFNQFYNVGIGIPLWTDLAIQIGANKEFTWQFSDITTIAETHPSYQTGGVIDRNNYQHLKIANPWLLKCDDDIKFLLCGSPYNSLDSEYNDIQVVPGIVDYKYMRECNINMLIKNDKPKRLLIPMGDMIANLIPLTEKEVIVKRHVISTEELKSMYIRRITFFNSHKLTKNKVKQFSKCPYSKK